MTLKHQIRPPSRSGVVGGYPSLTRSSSSSLAGFSTSAASSRPSTSYPVVTPQLDNSSLYSASVSDFTTSHYGAYDHPQPTSPPPYPAYHGHGGGGAQDGSSSAVPSTIFINQKEIDGFEGDASITSSVWSSLEFDEFSEAEMYVFPPTHYLIPYISPTSPPLPSQRSASCLFRVQRIRSNISRGIYSISW